MKYLIYTLLFFSLALVSCDDEITCRDCTEQEQFFGTLDVFDIPQRIYARENQEQDDWIASWFGTTHPKTVIGTLEGLKNQISYYRDDIFTVSPIHLEMERPDFAEETGGMDYSSTFYTFIDSQGLEQVVEIGEDADHLYFSQYHLCESGFIFQCQQTWVRSMEAIQSKTDLEGEVNFYINGTRLTESWRWSLDARKRFVFETESKPIFGFDSEKRIEINKNKSGSVTSINSCYAYDLSLPNCSDKSIMIWSWNALGEGFFDWEAAEETANW